MAFLFFYFLSPTAKIQKSFSPKQIGHHFGHWDGVQLRGKKKKEKKKHFVSAVPESLLGTCGPAQVIALSDPHDAQSWGATDRQHWEPTRHLCERVGVTGSPQSLRPSLL